VVAVGDKVNVKILDIDPKRRRISLSVKQTTEPPEGYEPAPVSHEDYFEGEPEPQPEPEISPEPEPEIEPEPEPEPEVEEAKADEKAEEETGLEPPADTLEAIVRDMKQGS
jgi:transcriptional accessory protein Tex/SPT6